MKNLKIFVFFLCNIKLKILNCIILWYIYISNTLYNSLYTPFQNLSKNREHVQHNSIVLTKRSVREVKYSLHSGPFICGFLSWTARQSINIRKTGYLRVYDRIHAWATTKQEQQIRKQKYCLWKFELNCHIKVFWRLFLLQPFNLWLDCSVNIKEVIKNGSINFCCMIMGFRWYFYYIH